MQGVQLREHLIECFGRCLRMSRGRLRRRSGFGRAGSRSLKSFLQLVCAAFTGSDHPLSQFLDLLRCPYFDTPSSYALGAAWRRPAARVLPGLAVPDLRDGLPIRPRAVLHRARPHYAVPRSEPAVRVREPPQCVPLRCDKTMKPAQVLLGEDVVERLDALDLGPCLQTLSNYSYPVPLGCCWSGDRYVRRRGGHRYGVSRRTVRRRPTDQSHDQADDATKYTARYRAIEARDRETKQAHHPDWLAMSARERAEHPDQPKRDTSSNRTYEEAEEDSPDHVLHPFPSSALVPSAAALT